VKNKLRVVIDTNVLLVAISSKSEYHWIFKNLLNGSYELYISNEILMEYEEIISSKFNSEVAQDVLRALLMLPNVLQTAIYFKWNLISEDPDDNKFVDCAVSANVDYLVSNDNHFSILESIDFPKISIIKAKEFKDVLNLWKIFKLRYWWYAIW